MESEWQFELLRKALTIGLVSSYIIGIIMIKLSNYLIRSVLEPSALYMVPYLSIRAK